MLPAMIGARPRRHGARSDLARNDLGTNSKRRRQTSRVAPALGRALNYLHAPALAGPSCTRCSPCCVFVQWIDEGRGECNKGSSTHSAVWTIDGRAVPLFFGNPFIHIQAPGYIHIYAGIAFARSRGA
jgi:hypothetical protein